MSDRYRIAFCTPDREILEILEDTFETGEAAERCIGFQYGCVPTETPHVFCGTTREFEDFHMCVVDMA